MTKEQEKAIEYFKKHIKYFEEQIKFIEAADCDYYDEELELYQNRVRQFNIVLSMLKEKDKIIDLMAEMLVKVPENNFIAKCINQDLEEKKKEIKRYFENKAKELLNK